MQALMTQQARHIGLIRTAHLRFVQGYGGVGCGGLGVWVGGWWLGLTTCSHVPHALRD